MMKLSGDSDNHNVNKSGENHATACFPVVWPRVHDTEFDRDDPAN